MHVRVAVNFGGGGLQDACLDALGEPQHVDGPHDGCLGGLDGVVLVMYRGGGAGEIVDFVHLGVIGSGDVVAHHLEIAASGQVHHVSLAAGKIVVEADDVVAFAYQPFAQVRTYESGSSGYKHSLHRQSFSVADGMRNTVFVDANIAFFTIPFERFPIFIPSVSAVGQ